MAVFARGKRAYGFCDRCGFRYNLVDLKSETDTGVSRNNRVCPECWDADHPQNFLFKIQVDDRIALDDPRPDTAQAESRRLSAWNPVGYHQATSELKVHLGQVKVITS